MLAMMVSHHLQWPLIASLISSNGFQWLSMASDLPPMASDCLPHQVDIFVAELVAMTKQHGRTAPRRENSPLTLLSSKAWGAHRAGHA
jgi:hypothetical protein